MAALIFSMAASSARRNAATEKWRSISLSAGPLAFPRLDEQGAAAQKIRLAIPAKFE
ncbi:hypothetical protein [Mesorhizobium sp. KR2-14]|uniref:hypothetical protein n=1 Tax=Mesorhizobium sp. KR2-14 TaxID=3156610 RepID=UPI0032B5E413